MQNVFDQEVYQTVDYRVSPPVVEQLAEMNIAQEQLSDLKGQLLIGD